MVLDGEENETVRRLLQERLVLVTFDGEIADESVASIGRDFVDLGGALVLLLGGDGVGTFELLDESSGSLCQVESGERRGCYF